MAFQMQQQAAFAAVPLTFDLALARGKDVHISPLVFSSCRSDLPSLLGSPHEQCKVAENSEMSYGVSFAAN